MSNRLTLDNQFSKGIPFCIAVCVALLPALFLRDFTISNELRYLSIADEALSNHKFLTFTNHGVPYADKPPLYLWAVMLCRWITGGHHLWLLSLFSLLPAFGILRVMEKWTAEEMDGRGQELARLMLMTSGLFIGMALVLRMDMLMTFFIVLALREFWKMYQGEDSSGRAGWLFPVYTFLALFTKGPMGISIPLVGTAAFLLVSGQIRMFFRFWNWRTWAVLAVLCFLWFFGVYLEGGTEYLNNLLFHQTVDRAVNSFHHAEPFWFYIVCFWYCLAPWCLLVAGGLGTALRPSFLRSDLQRFFFAVTISSFILLSCVSSKLEIYMLPIVPLFVYLAAMSLPDTGKDIWQRICLSVPAAIFALIAPVLFIIAPRMDIAYLNEKMIRVAAIVLSLAGILSLWALWGGKCKDHVLAAVRRMAAGMLLALFLGGWALPQINPEIGYGTLCEKALEVSEKYGITDICTWDLRRSENMDVYLHRQVEIIPKEMSPDNEKPCILLTRTRDLVHFTDCETIAVGKFAVVVYK